MELAAYRSYRSPDMEISYWRTSTGREVDFVINNKELAVEVKASARISQAQAKDLSALAEDAPVKRRIMVCMEKQRRELQDAHGLITLLPWKESLKELWAGAT